MSWNEIKIKDIGKVVTGNTPPTIKKEYFGGEYPFIKPSDLNDDEMYPPKTEMTLSENGRILLSKNLLPKHTPCVVTIGTIGKMCFTAEPSFTNQQINAIIPDLDKFDNFFIYYLMKYHIPSVKVLNGGSASGRENVNKSSFSNIKVKVPTLAIQKRIASILSNYDNLIENNNQRIQLLEEMAEEIYKEWFVRLRFPGYENVVFVNKDGNKVARENDAALPEGWKKEQLREHINFFRGKSYSSAELRDNEGLAMLNLKNIKRQGGFRLDGLKYFEGKYNFNNEAYSGDIVMAVTDMTQEREIVGRVALVPDMGIEKFIISMDLIRIEPVELPKLYLYCFFRYSGIGLQLKEFANGANVLHLTPSLIELQKAIIPPSTICEKFEELVKPMLSEIDVLNNKNKVLQETRDLLLPRLISGKLSVAHLLDDEKEYNSTEVALNSAAEPETVYKTSI